MAVEMKRQRRSTRQGKHGATRHANQETQESKSGTDHSVA